MNRSPILFGIIFVLIIILCGCTTHNGKPIGNNKVEIVDYSIQTQKHIAVDMEDWIKLADGFFNTTTAERYFINGTVKNIANYTLAQVNITANFYDSNNHFLHSESVFIYNFPSTNTTAFEISYWSTTPYFENVNHMNFNISAP
jgi:hypothetical protein